MKTLSDRRERLVKVNREEAFDQPLREKPPHPDVSPNTKQWREWRAQHGG